MPALPTEIAAQLGRTVIGQERAVREMAVALAKSLGRLDSGNILLIGSSGTGKTTLMRSVESYLEALDEGRPPVVRIHANVLGEEAEHGRPGQVLIGKLIDQAQLILGRDAEPDAVLDRARRGVVFVDEVDKIRTRVGGETNIHGIRAQEALLTLMEGEAMELDAEHGFGSATAFATDELLFVAGGAFEGLYDAVYDRVTVGIDRGALTPVTVVEEGRVAQRLEFDLRDWLRLEDLFDYGLGPQFLARFESIVLLDELDEGDLLRILLEIPDAGYRQATEYFGAHDVQLALSPAAAQRIAAAARRRRRIGARALREIFHRVIRDWEFDPSQISGGVLTIDATEVDAALENLELDR